MRLHGSEFDRVQQLIVKPTLHDADVAARGATRWFQLPLPRTALSHRRVSSVSLLSPASFPHSPSFSLLAIRGTVMLPMRGTGSTARACPRF